MQQYEFTVTVIINEPVNQLTIHFSVASYNLNKLIRSGAINSLTIYIS